MTLGERTAPPRPDRRQSPSGTGNFRADIQGLRALAVLAVVADHLFGWPTGGFVGVDVFFVISGFLITGLMLREHSRTGRISWTGFYRRRARRILPAATVCLIVVVVISYLLFRRARFDAVAWDAFWSFLFVSNWHFAGTGTDYFQATTLASPLQHFWSLAVEEQFYVVWPVLLICVVKTLPGRIAKLSVVLGVAFALVVALSFAWAVIQSPSSPTVAYFSTFTRAWELGVGAFLALAANRVRNLSALFKAVLLFGGLALIAVSLFAISPESRFPGPWAALPVLGTVLVLSSGVGSLAPGVVVLSNRPAVYIGQISYSLYLWHFPVIVLLAAVMSPSSLTYFAIALLLMGAMSIGSYRWVEMPFLPAKEGNSGGSRASDGMTARGRAQLCVVVVLLLVAGMSWVAVGRQTKSATSAAVAVAAAASPADGSSMESSSGGLANTGRSTGVSDRAAQILSALQATSWPVDLNPSIDSVDKDASAAQWVQDGCLGLEKNVKSDDAIVNTQHCLYGDRAASKHAVVIGDSVAISYVPGLVKALGPDWSVQLYTLVQCPVSNVNVFIGAADRKQPNEQCSGFRQWAISQIQASSPDLVVASDSIATLKMEQDASAGTQAVDLWREGLTSSLKAMSNAKQVVFLPGPPVATKSIQECATQLSTPSDCVTKAGEGYGDYSRAAEQAVSAAGGNTRFVPTQSWFCSSDQPDASCPIFIGQAPVFVDKSHLTNSASELLAPLLSESLQAQASPRGSSG